MIKMGPQKYTYFMEEWLSNPAFFWVQKVVGDNKQAKCSLCCKQFNLSNMGVKALHSHAGGATHKRREAARKAHPIELYTVPNAQELPVGVLSNTAAGGSAAPSVPLPVLSASAPALAADATISPSVSSAAASALPSSTPVLATGNLAEKNLRTGTLRKFLLSEQVTKAEILWTLNSVASHDSQRSAARGVSLFPLMFPDSEIAQKMQLQRTKIGYTINHGLGPYFKGLLNQTLEKCEHVVLCFDESLNKISQRQQMDLHVRFWDNINKQTASRYLTSCFLGHTTAEDLLSSFKSAVGDELLNKTIQVSMDGPSVNFKFLRILKEDLSKNPGSCVILDLGSCGLHVVHGAVKTGVKATDWSIIEFLRSLYYLFKDVPSRRADYIKYSGTSVFPLKFCAVRWVENCKVAGRAVQLLPFLKKYVAGVEGSKKTPKCKSYLLLKEALKDPLLACKLQFFISLCELTEPFLREFQTDKPLAPFLYETITSLLQTFMAMFVKEDVLDKADCLAKIDISKEKDNLRTAKQIKLGYAVKGALRDVREDVKDIDILNFRQDCRDCLIALTGKLIERSPLKFRMTKAVSCLDPSLISSQPKVALERLRTGLQELERSHWFPGAVADRIERQYRDFTSLPDGKASCKEFRRSDQRLDVFYVDVFSRDAERFRDLAAFVRFICTLSHGNAATERGFSVNKECLVENQTEISLISQRHVYDAVLVSGGVEQVDVTKLMVHAARNAAAVSKEYASKQKKERESKEKEDDEKKRAAEERKELTKKKMKVLADARKEAESLDLQIASLPR